VNQASEESFKAGAPGTGIDLRSRGDCLAGVALVGTVDGLKDYRFEKSHSIFTPSA
jgi:hypothetical protein